MHGISLFRSRPKKHSSPGFIPILLLILSWIYPGPGPISLPSRSYFYPDSTLDLVPAFSLSLSLFYRGCVPILMLSWFYPRSGQKENLVSLQVPDAFWQSLDNDFSSVLEKYLWHMSCDNMTFGRSLGGTYKLLFLTKNWSRSRSRFNPCKKLWFRNYFSYRYLNHFYISLEGKSLFVKRCSRFETTFLKTWPKEYYWSLKYARIRSINK